MYVKKELVYIEFSYNGDEAIPEISWLMNIIESGNLDDIFDLFIGQSHHDYNDFMNACKILKSLKSYYVYSEDGVLYENKFDASKDNPYVYNDILSITKYISTMRELLHIHNDKNLDDEEYISSVKSSIDNFINVSNYEN